MKISVQLVSPIALLLFTSNVCTAKSTDDWTDKCIRQIFDPTAPIVDFKDAMLSQAGNYLYDLIVGLPARIGREVQNLYAQYDGDVEAILKHTIRTVEDSAILNLATRFGHPQGNILDVAMSLASQVLPKAYRDEL